MTTVSPPVVPVSFAGDRAGRWPVTLGQGNVFDWLASADAHGAVFNLYADLPADSTPRDVYDAVAVLVSRHEGLRTRYEVDPDGQRTQIVVPAGQLDVRLLELGDQARHCTQVTEPLQLFDHSNEYPVRVAVALDHGSPVRAVFEFSHLAADLVAATIVLAEFTELMAMPVKRNAHPPAWQPADQAGYEQTPAAIASMAKTVDYWRAQVSDSPVCMLSVPAHTQGPPEFRQAAIRSTSLSTILREVSARTRVSPATVLVSTLAMLLSWWTDNPRFVIDVLYSNRSLPNMRDYVGVVAQSAIVPFGQTSSSFYETLSATQAVLWNAYRFAYFDGTAVAALVESIGRRRGCERHRDLVINDMSTVGGEAFDGRQGTQPEPVADESASGLETSTMDPLRLTILRTSPVVTLGLSHDTRYVSNTEAAAFLAAMQRLLTLAAHRDVDVGSLGDLLELEPVRREESWTRLSSGWVDLATSERLFREAAGDPGARVFLEHGALVGYSAPADPRIDPQHLHTASMAGLGGRHGAITPDRYVICAPTPRPPDSHAAWQAQPVRAAGPGR